MEFTAIRQRLEHGFICSGRVNCDRQTADGLTKPQTAWKPLEIVSAGKMENCLGRDFPECKKAQGGRTVRRQKEILMDDEFSMIILLYHVAF